MNVKLLRKVQKFLLDEPRRFDMSNWVRDSGLSNILKHPPCGTACCIAGAAFVLDKKLSLKKSTFDGVTVEIDARCSLELTPYESDRLFYRINWPGSFSLKYGQAKTPLARAKVGVARIEHFIKTGGQE